MLYFDRIDVSEGFGVNRKVHQKNVIFLSISSFK